MCVCVCLGQVCRYYNNFRKYTKRSKTSISKRRTNFFRLIAYDCRGCYRNLKLHNKSGMTKEQQQHKIFATNIVRTISTPTRSEEKVVMPQPKTILPQRTRDWIKREAVGGQKCINLVGITSRSAKRRVVVQM